MTTNNAIKPGSQAEDTPEPEPASSGDVITRNGEPVEAGSFVDAEQFKAENVHYLSTARVTEVDGERIIQGDTRRTDNLAKLDRHLASIDEGSKRIENKAAGIVLALFYEFSFQREEDGEAFMLEMSAMRDFCYNRKGYAASQTADERKANVDRRPTQGFKNAVSDAVMAVRIMFKVPDWGLYPVEVAPGQFEMKAPANVINPYLPKAVSGVDKASNPSTVPMKVGREKLRDIARRAGLLKERAPKIEIGASSSAEEMAKAFSPEILASALDKAFSNSDVAELVSETFDNAAAPLAAKLALRFDGDRDTTEIDSLKAELAADKVAMLKFKAYAAAAVDVFCPIEGDAKKVHRVTKQAWVDYEKHAETLAAEFVSG